MSADFSCRSLSDSLEPLDSLGHQDHSWIAIAEHKLCFRTVLTTKQAQGAAMVLCPAHRMATVPLMIILMGMTRHALPAVQAGQNFVGGRFPGQPQSPSESNEKQRNSAYDFNKNRQCLAWPA
eukprot:CAMPEP_0202849030 /NCGR_PEP_ID=MMETSP1389-20130828/79629_1 /ASSEMBLY_ACC=CAM_ASM_000865 /TAXON_ID=302021 /ORGANISM="Rhodomonas sp., Strain CCMP768" /LENGTH=122 /DNA_ID=CAMNT_0049526987 /DNA_START=22 /DNA_END=386 /DNA_ORIENTATION=+